MRGKSVLLLMLALGCGLVASIGITQVMSAKNSAPKEVGPKMEAIYVAIADIPMGDLITAEHISLEEWPKDKMPPGAVFDLEEVEGRRPKSKIYAGSPILANQLGNNAGAVSQIPPGYRAISVRVDDVSSTGGMIRPGDRVDLLLHLRRNMADSINQTTTRTLLQDVKVFAIGDVFDLEATDGKSIKATTISLLLKPDQAETVSLATELGSIRLALRSHEDKEEADVHGATIEQLTKSSTGDRDSEDMSTAPGASDFMAFMDGMSAGQEPIETPPNTTEWNLRLIKGAQAETVTMELETTLPSTDESSEGFSLWSAFPSSMREMTSGLFSADDEESEEDVEEDPAGEDPAGEE